MLPQECCQCRRARQPGAAEHILCSELLHAADGERAAAAPLAWHGCAPHLRRRPHGESTAAAVPSLRRRRHGPAHDGEHKQAVARAGVRVIAPACVKQPTARCTTPHHLAHRRVQRLRPAQQPARRVRHQPRSCGNLANLTLVSLGTPPSPRHVTPAARNRRILPSPACTALSRRAPPPAGAPAALSRTQRPAQSAASQPHPAHPQPPPAPRHVARRHARLRAPRRAQQAARAAPRAMLARRLR